jgi:hypothetical protein
MQFVGILCLFVRFFRMLNHFETSLIGDARSGLAGLARATLPGNVSAYVGHRWVEWMVDSPRMCDAVRLGQTQSKLIKLFYESEIFSFQPRHWKAEQHGTTIASPRSLPYVRKGSAPVRVSQAWSGSRRK